MSEWIEYFINADTIITDRGVLRNKSLHIKNGRIEGCVDTRRRGHSTMVLDYPGCTLAPCFCDYHLHFFKDTADYQSAAADALISSGITRVFEGGDKNLSGLNAKNALTNLIDIKTAGHAIYKRGAYGGYIGRGVENAGEARDIINRLKDKDVDYIKIIHSGIFEPSTGRITPGGFEREELHQIVDFTRDLGLDVACHANSDQAVREAVEAGVSFVIHGLFVSKETLSLMAEKEIKFIPTLNAFSSLTAIADNAESMKNIQKAVDGHLAAIKTAFLRGVDILPGSDSGPSFIPYGTAYQDELNLLRRAGLPLEYILTSATASPLAKGLSADFLVLNGLDVKKVFIGGVCMDEPAS